MEDMLETETKLWYKKLGGCCRESYHMCTDIKIEEGGIYEVCQLEKQTKMSYKMVHYLTHASKLSHTYFMRFNQGVVIYEKVDG